LSRKVKTGYCNIIRDSRNDKLSILKTQTMKALCSLVETVLFVADRYEEQCGKSDDMAALEGLMTSLQISPTA
jgi:hypothetical protein